VTINPRKHRAQAKGRARAPIFTDAPPLPPRVCPRASASTRQTANQRSLPYSAGPVSIAAITAQGLQTKTPANALDSTHPNPGAQWRDSRQ
jgi:hypothetical protein